MCKELGIDRVWLSYVKIGNAEEKVVVGPAANVADGRCVYRERCVPRSSRRKLLVERVGNRKSSPEGKGMDELTQRTRKRRSQDAGWQPGVRGLSRRREQSRDGTKGEVAVKRGWRRRRKAWVGCQCFSVLGFWEWHCQWQAGRHGAWSMDGRNGSPVGI